MWDVNCISGMSDVNNILYPACPALTHPPIQASVCVLLHLSRPVHVPRTRQKSFQDNLLHLLRTGPGLEDCASVGGGVVAWSLFSCSGVLSVSSISASCVLSFVSDGSVSSAYLGSLMGEGGGGLLVGGVCECG